VDVCVTVNADRPWKGNLRFYSPALRETACVHAEAGKGRTEIRAEGLLLREDVHRWDLGDGTCFVMTAAADGLDTVSVRFGVRDFGTRDGHFTLNGRIIHLRAEANCARGTNKEFTYEAYPSDEEIGVKELDFAYIGEHKEELLNQWTELWSTYGAK
jgi:hypothetical protein